MVDTPRSSSVSQSVSQSITQFASDGDASLGLTSKNLNDAEKDLARFEKQADSKIAKWGFKALGGIFGFGRNLCTPFNETAADLNRIARQSDSTPVKLATHGLGATFATGSTALRLPHDLAMGILDFAEAPIATLTSVPDVIQHSGNDIIAGAKEVFRGNVATGLSQFWNGVIGDSTIVLAILGIFKAAPKAYSGYTKAVNGALMAGKRPLSAVADAFDRAAQHPELGGVRVPNFLRNLLRSKNRVGAEITYSSLTTLSDTTISHLIDMANQSRKRVLVRIDDIPFIINPGDALGTVMTTFKMAKLRALASKGPHAYMDLVISNAIVQANKHNTPVVLRINNASLTINPGDTLQIVKAAFDDGIKKGEFTIGVEIEFPPLEPSLDTLIPQATEVANQFDVIVFIEFDRIELKVKPGDTPQAIRALFDGEVQSRKIKAAQAARHPELGGVRLGTGKKAVELDPAGAGFAMHSLRLRVDAAQNFASQLHNDWRVGRAATEGVAVDGLPLREARWKAVASSDPSLPNIPDTFKRAAGDKVEVDIANLDFSRLPDQFKHENLRTAEGAVAIVDHAIMTQYKGGHPFTVTLDMETAAAKVHEQWLERNGEWAPAEQKLPYAELSEVEKTKDRTVMKCAIDHIQGPLQKAGIQISIKTTGPQ